MHDWLQYKVGGVTWMCYNKNSCCDSTGSLWGVCIYVLQCVLHVTLLCSCLCVCKGVQVCVFSPWERGNMQSVGENMDIRRAGSIPANKCMKMHFEPYYTEAVYRRATRDTFQSRIHVNKTGVFTFKDVDGSDTNVRPLRPLANKPKLVDAYVKPCCSGHPDLYTYKLYRPVDIQRMFIRADTFRLLGIFCFRKHYLYLYHP